MKEGFYAMLTIDEIEKAVWNKMQQAIAQRDAQAVAALNGMALEAAEIKERVRSLATKLGGPNLSNGVPPQGRVGAPTSAAPSGVSARNLVDVPGNYTGRPIRSYRLNGVSTIVRTYKDLLIDLSNTLRTKHGARFDQCALQLGGRKRRYFSHSQQDLKYAHEVDGGGLFAETNLNANLIVNNICIPLLRQLEPGAQFEIQ
jgi:hypothetical protein